MGHASMLITALAHGQQVCKTYEDDGKFRIKGDMYLQLDPHGDRLRRARRAAMGTKLRLPNRHGRSLRIGLCCKIMYVDGSGVCLVVFVWERTAFFSLERGLCFMMGWWWRILDLQD